MLRFIGSPSRTRRRISGVKLATPVIRKASPSVRIGGVTGVPMELRAALGVYDEIAGRFTVYTSAGGGVIRQRDDIAGVLGVPKDVVRVVSGDVGGNFGSRNNTCPEFVLVAWAAKRVGRPVKWICERREAFLTDFGFISALQRRHEPGRRPGRRGY